MARISKRALLLALLATAAAACSDGAATQTCVTESDCLSGQICRNRKCETPRTCRTNTDCIATEVCQNGRCEPRPCDDDDVCGSGRVCESGWCVVPGSADCQSDLECASGTCDMVHGICLLGDACTSEGCQNRDAGLADIHPCGHVPCEQSCTRQAECDTPNVCDVGAGVCREVDCNADGDCPRETYCELGACRRGCRAAHDDCPLGYCDEGTRRCTPSPCVDHAHCPGGFCALFAAESQAMRRCIQGETPAEYTPCLDDSDCPTGACLEHKYCFWPCRDSRSCGAGSCGRSQWLHPSGHYGVVTCFPPLQPCAADIQCPVGEVCLPTIVDRATVLRCQSPPPGRPAGAQCDIDTQCLSQACIYSTCWGPCEPGRNEQCGAGLRCYENVHYVTTQLNDPVGPYMGLAGCLSSRGSDANCESAPCPAGEVCTLQADSSGTGWHLRCRDEVGERRAGAACDADIQCRSNHCAISGYCIEPCTEDENCVEATACSVVLLGLRNGSNNHSIEAAANVCAPPRP